MLKHLFRAQLIFLGLIHKRIVKAINAALNKKHLAQSESASVNISYSVSIEKVLSNSGVSTSIGLSAGRSNRGHVSMNSGNQIKQILEGTLVVDITSIKDGALLWRGISTKTISNRSSSPEKSQSRINETVNQLLENFPPPVEKS